MAAVPTTRIALPLAALCCLGLILFLIAATIVLALIPIYLKARGPVGNINGTRIHTLSKTLNTAVLNQTGVSTILPLNKSRRRRQMHDESPPLAVNQR